ncbi:MAG: hypothetical protein O2960_29835 [Verrucomicrobia bacterium]|nr:hypothetical protein [Verrucomicrobiota bacterium]
MESLLPNDHDHRPPLEMDVGSESSVHEIQSVGTVASERRFAWIKLFDVLLIDS